MLKLVSDWLIWWKWFVCAKLSENIKHKRILVTSCLFIKKETGLSQWLILFLYNALQFNVLTTERCNTSSRAIHKKGCRILLELAQTQCVYMYCICRVILAPGLCVCVCAREGKREGSRVKLVNCVSSVKVGQVVWSSRDTGLGEGTILRETILGGEGMGGGVKPRQLTIWWAHNSRGSLLDFRPI